MNYITYDDHLFDIECFIVCGEMFCDVLNVIMKVEYAGIYIRRNDKENKIISIEEIFNE